jgi:hypothetical protein
MMMSIENGNELKILMSQEIQNRNSITRIDYGSMAVVVNDPDIIISECADRNYI